MEAYRCMKFKSTPTFNVNATFLTNAHRLWACRGTPFDDLGKIPLKLHPKALAGRVLSETLSDYNAARNGSVSQGLEKSSNSLDVHVELLVYSVG